MLSNLQVRPPKKPLFNRLDVKRTDSRVESHLLANMSQGIVHRRIPSAHNPRHGSSTTGIERPYFIKLADQGEPLLYCWPESGPRPSIQESRALKGVSASREDEQEVEQSIPKGSQARTWEHLGKRKNKRFVKYSDSCPLV